MLDTFLTKIQLDSIFYQQVGILLVAMLLAQFISVPRRKQPLYHFEQLAISFSQKVNHPNRSANQRIIAGTLAAISLVFPLWIVVIFLIELSIYPWFFEVLILFACMLDNGFSKTSSQIEQQLNQQNNAQAKKLLALWCQRDTNKLSAIGISKACIEKMAELGSTNIIVVFGYLLGGTYLAVLLKMLKQLGLAWPSSNPHFHKFNALIHKINRIVLYVPNIAWSFLLLEPCKIRSWQLFFTKIIPFEMSGCNTLNMSLLAFRLNIELGGPRIYNAIKVSINKIEYGKLPSISDINKTVNIFELSNLIIISITMLTAVINFYLEALT
ncbi:hypothetical protein D5R81_06690 [Parashewanella spongiae]|uniref:Cobalamin biosynthesis protein CbiB n=1 Tax=Parashewanella spongiae TaxID=342950 RepID=A0A3A6U880_9GAMM|nr:cobalamin biosynthesis protein [Parashewanella spongiae]MCL1077649.1 cobalamin biosynthesis protein [Parashewanella spongiae]RJY18124.1 hypothetical protein D5R81_06690 [Parashewanella spongiae]